MAAHVAGPGLSIQRLSVQEEDSDLQALLLENADLRAEVQALQQLLQVWQPRCVCQLHGSSTSSSSSGSGTAAAPSVDRVLRQQQVLIAQQQRQLLILQGELASRKQVVLEADAVLAETSRRLSSLAQHDTAQQQPTRPSAGSHGGGQGAVLELLAWCHEADARIQRSKAASAAACRGAGRLQAGSNSSSGGVPSRRAGSSSGGGGSGGGGSSKQQWQSSAVGAPKDSSAQQLPYLAAGGNAYLHTHLTLPGLAAGEGLAFALSCPALQQLMQQLATLAAPLAAFAVQLRSSILPALPWVQASQLGPELLSSCATLAQQAAAAAVQLAQLCAVLPAASGALSSRSSQTGSSSKQRAQHKLQQASPTRAGTEEAAVGSCLTSQQAVQLEHEDQALLQELEAVLGSPSAAGRQSRGSRAASLAAAMKQRLHVLALKQRVLNEQLSFLAKCSAAQPKLMTALASDVLQELAAAVDAAETASHQRKQRARALQLCSQLQRAALLAAGDSSANAARAVLMLLDSNRDTLDDLPKLLAASSASALKNAATAAVVHALTDFKAALRP